MELTSNYNCPICGNVHYNNDSVIIKQEINRKFLYRKHNSEMSTYRMKVYDEYYQVSYYNIRICPTCAKKRKVHYYYAALVVVLGIVALMIRNLLQFPNETVGDITNSVFLALIPGGIVGGVIFILICVLIAKSHKIDIEKAKGCNAIVRERPNW